ncbi:MAG: hypothetical protein Q4D29_03610 [Lachnospiraceae bacterium]|nr:hypothetical protein [Lachnospiraceae bacterium]
MENYEYRPTPSQVNRNNGAKIKRLKRKNRNKSIWIIILVVVIVILLAGIGIGYAKYYKKNYKDPSFEYISMTEEASARAYVWLSKIEDTDLSYEEVKNCMGNFNLEVIKKPTDVKGEYTYELAEGGYDYCRNQARVGFEKAYYEAIKKRIVNSGYEGTVDDELVDRLMTETFGMSVSQYIDECDIKLLPDLVDINVKEILEHNEKEETEVTNEK